MVKLIIAFCTNLSYDSLSLRTEVIDFASQPPSHARALAKNASDQIKADFEGSGVKVTTSIIETD